MNVTSVKIRAAHYWQMRLRPALLGLTVCRFKGHYYKFGYLRAARCLRCDHDRLPQ